MTKTEFLQELSEALQGEVPVSIIQENIQYYGNYISQETAKGRTEDDIMEELGGPRIIARTIIDSSEAAGETSGQSGTYYSQTESTSSSGQTPTMKSYNLNKWYWKLLLIVVIIFFFSIIFTVVGGVFSLLFRFAGPLIIIWLVYSLFRGMRR